MPNEKAIVRRVKLTDMRVSCDEETRAASIWANPLLQFGEVAVS
jgi:hypothetical protein